MFENEIKYEMVITNIEADMLSKNLISYFTWSFRLFLNANKTIEIKEKNNVYKEDYKTGDQIIIVKKDRISKCSSSHITKKKILDLTHMKVLVTVVFKKMLNIISLN